MKTDYRELLLRLQALDDRKPEDVKCKKQIKEKIARMRQMRRAAKFAKKKSTGKFARRAD